MNAKSFSGEQGRPVLFNDFGSDPYAGATYNVRSTIMKQGARKPSFSSFFVSLPAIAAALLLLSSPAYAGGAKGDGGASSGERRVGRGGLQIEWGDAVEEAERIDETSYDAEAEEARCAEQRRKEEEARRNAQKKPNEDFFDDRIEFNSRHQADL